MQAFVFLLVLTFSHISTANTCENLEGDWQGSCLFESGGVRTTEPFQIILHQAGCAFLSIDKILGLNMVGITSINTNLKAQTGAIQYSNTFNSEWADSKTLVNVKTEQQHEIDSGKNSLFYAKYTLERSSDQLLHTGSGFSLYWSKGNYKKEKFEFACEADLASKKSKVKEDGSPLYKKFGIAPIRK